MVEIASAVLQYVGITLFLAGFILRIVLDLTMWRAKWAEIKKRRHESKHRKEK